MTGNRNAYNRYIAASLGQEVFNINAEMICTKQFPLNNLLQNCRLFKCIVAFLGTIIFFLTKLCYCFAAVGGYLPFFKGFQNALVN